MTSLSDRMKDYEFVNKNKLMANVPAIIRIDGKAFHTWTKGLDKPFDEKFYAAMSQTAIDLVNNIQGAVFAYGQSDEISIFLKDYETYNTDAWFGGGVQKIVSVSASLATGYFNKAAEEVGIAKDMPALFDSRVFSIPQHDVTNYFVWRQQDFLRNSIQMCARHYLGHKACHGLKKQDMIDALRNREESFDWFKDLDMVYRHGYSYIRGMDEINFTIPEFTECREFIEVHVYNSV